MDTEKITPPGVTAGRGSGLRSGNNGNAANHSAGDTAVNHFPRFISHRKVRDAMAVDLPRVSEPGPALEEMNRRFATAMVVTDGIRYRPAILENEELYASRSPVTLRVRVIAPKAFAEILSPLHVWLTYEHAPAPRRYCRLSTWWRAHPQRRDVGQVTAELLERAVTIEELLRKQAGGAP
jgi:hypothetical protein